ncbi:MAG TPA: hypothetical protein VG937_14500 [Polyangiaceae bacterium]|nr:hypothetical protein [Polyangiaceae bacterium]
MAIVGFALVLVPPGCGDTTHDDVATGGASGTGGSGGAGPTSGVPGVDEFHRSLWQAFCQQLFRCASANDDDIGSKASLGTEQRCADMVSEIEKRDPRFLDLNEKLASGVVRFVADKVPACLAEARSCSIASRANISFSGPACRAVFEGAVEPGGACQREEECAGDARCVVDQQCPGQCKARAAAGEACDQRQDCDDTKGHVECRFDSATGSSNCVPVAIAAAAEEGQPCTLILNDSTSFVPCADGLWCDGDTLNGASMGTCRARLADGAACDDDDDLCVDGDSCFDRTSCKPLQVGRQPGDTCDTATGSFCDPFARLSCVAGKCQVMGDGKSGSACVSIDINALLDCEPDLRCARSDTGATCAPFLTAGATCEGDSECASGTCAGGTCAAAYCDN